MPAEDDHGDVEHVDGGAQPRPQGAGGARDGAPGPLVAGPPGVHELVRPGVVGQARGGQDEPAPRVALHAAPVAAGAPRAVGVDLDVTDLAGEAVVARDDPPLAHDPGADAVLPGQVDEAGPGGRGGGALAPDGDRPVVRLVAQAQLQPRRRQDGAEVLGGAHVAPAQVGGAQEPVPADQAGQGEGGAHGPGAGDGVDAQDVGGQRGQAGQDLGGVGAGEVVDDDVLGQDLAGQVDGAHRHVGDIDLQAQGHEGAARRGQRDPGPARAGGGRRVELGEDAGRDEVVGEPGGGGAGHAGGGGDVGPGDGLGGGQDLPGHQGEVGGAQGRLAGRGRARRLRALLAGRRRSSCADHALTLLHGHDIVVPTNK